MADPMDFMQMDGGGFFDMFGSPSSPEVSAAAPEPASEPANAMVSQVLQEYNAKIAELTNKLDAKEGELIDVNKRLSECIDSKLAPEELEEYKKYKSIKSDLFIPYCILCGVIIIINLVFTYLHAANYRKSDADKYKTYKLVTEYLLLAVVIAPIFIYIAYNIDNIRSNGQYAPIYILIGIVILKLVTIAIGFLNNRGNFDMKYFYEM
jgi:hypothetical protein